MLLPDPTFVLTVLAFLGVSENTQPLCKVSEFGKSVVYERKFSMWRSEMEIAEMLTVCKLTGSLTA